MLSNGSDEQVWHRSGDKSGSHFYKSDEFMVRVARHSLNMTLHVSLVEFRLPMLATIRWGNFGQHAEPGVALGQLNEGLKVMTFTGSTTCSWLYGSLENCWVDLRDEMGTVVMTIPFPIQYPNG